MITIKKYIEVINDEFIKSIDNNPKLRCKLKELNFANSNVPDYSGITLQQYYLLRYAFAYAFEYSEMYREVLTQMGNVTKVSVASIGCGALVDYWSLVYALDKEYKPDCTVEYTGIDKLKWNYSFYDRCRPRDKVDFKKGNAQKLFDENNVFDSDIYFFPKSISEFSDSELKTIENNLSGKRIAKDKFFLCVSLRESYEDDDLNNTNRLIEAIKQNRYFVKREIETPARFKKKDSYIKSWYEDDKNFRYPENVFEDLGNIFASCNECDSDCTSRRPILTTKYIRYRIITLERRA